MYNIELTKEGIVDKLFRFIEEHFDDFNHKKDPNSNWWLSVSSWSPFVEACFLIWGGELKYNVGISYTHNNLPSFLEKIGYIDDKEKYQKPPDKGLDLSWHDENNRIILGLEHEETGNTAEKRINEICDEMDKLRNHIGLFKIIVSRPCLRKFKGDKDTYPNAIKHFKTEIERKLLNLEISSEEKWIIILIGPRNSHLTQKKDETEILFCSYIWNENKLSMFERKSFKVKMDEKQRIVKVRSP